MSILAIVALLVLSLEAQGLTTVFALVAGFVAWRAWRENRFRVDLGCLKPASLRFERKVAMTLAGIVVLLVIVAFFQHASANDKSRAESAAPAEWTRYQYVAAMRNQWQVAADLLTSTGKFHDDVYKAKIERCGDDMKAIQQSARSLEATVVEARQRASRLYMGQVLLEIAAILAALAIVAKRQTIWVISIGVAMGGITVAAWTWAALR